MIDLPTKAEWTSGPWGSGMNLGPLSVLVTRAPDGSGWRYKVGTYNSEPRFLTQEAAQWAGLRYVGKLCLRVVNLLEALPDWETEGEKGFKKKKGKKFSLFGDI